MKTVTLTVEFEVPNNFYNTGLLMAWLDGTLDNADYDTLTEEAGCEIEQPMVTFV